MAEGKLISKILLFEITTDQLSFNRVMKTFLVISMLMLNSCICCAQKASFKSLGCNEQPGYFSNGKSRISYERLKSKPSNPSGPAYINVGAEIRYQYFYFKNEDWGEEAPDPDGFVLSRFLTHVDLHAGKQFRGFLQLQSSLANGQPKTPSPVDNNQLEIHQAFADILLPVSDQKLLTFRIGRQELSYGSQRLVAVREGPNNRQSFDGLKLNFTAPNRKFDLLYSQYVKAEPGIFDDRIHKGIRLWGSYNVFTNVPWVNNFDLYYLGLYKKTTAFNAGRGEETRHSIGTRVWKSSGPWQYDNEAIYQFGRFSGQRVSAWTMSMHLSYTFLEKKFTPQLGLKSEFVSGDRHAADGQLNTFNPLFPKGAYFGLAALIGPSNLVDTHPYIQLAFSEKLSFGVDYDLFWRMQREDGLYAVNGKLIYAAEAGTSKRIGQQLGTSIEYTPNKFLYFRQELTWFNSGEFLKQAGPGKDILMLGTTITLKF